jgi:hypothetical protein
MAETESPLPPQKPKYTPNPGVTAPANVLEKRGIEGGRDMTGPQIPANQQKADHE